MKIYVSLDIEELGAIKIFFHCNREVVSQVAYALHQNRLVWP